MTIDNVSTSVRKVAVYRITLRDLPSAFSARVGQVVYGDTLITTGNGEWLRVLAVNGVECEGYLAARWTREG